MAAGRSRRFGDTDKRLAVLPDGRSLLASSCALARQAFADVRVVLREADDPVALGLVDPALRLIRAPHGEAGLGASLADAFLALVQQGNRVFAIGRARPEGPDMGEVLAELGYDDEAIERLRESSAVVESER